MKKQAYKTKSGRTLYKPVMSCARFETLITGEENSGWCLHCGTETDGLIEPDACGYTCQTCREPKVYGWEQLLLMELIVLTDAEEEE